MARQSFEDERRIFAQTLREIGLHWEAAFDDHECRSLNYFDLFTEMWLKPGEAIYKTDAYRFMPRVSPQTAKKYVQRAIALGYMLESDNPRDGRSKLVSLSPRLKGLLEENFDYTAAALRKVLSDRPADN